MVRHFSSSPNFGLNVRMCRIENYGTFPGRKRRLVVIRRGKRHVRLKKHQSMNFIPNHLVSRFTSEDLQRWVKEYLTLAVKSALFRRLKFVMKGFYIPLIPTSRLLRSPKVRGDKKLVKVMKMSFYSVSFCDLWVAVGVYGTLLFI